MWKKILYRNIWRKILERKVKKNKEVFYWLIFLFLWNKKMWKTNKYGLFLFIFLFFLWCLLFENFGPKNSAFVLAQFHTQTQFVQKKCSFCKKWTLGKLYPLKAKRIFIFQEKSKTMKALVKNQKNYCLLILLQYFIVNTIALEMYDY